MLRTSRHALFVAVVAVVATCPTAGCSVLVATDGLVGITDAGAPLASDSGADGGARSDGGRDGEAGLPQAFCAKHPSATFCADFDDGDVAAGWTGRVITAKAASVALGKDGVSPPASLVASVPPPGNGDVSARLYRDLPEIASHVHIEVDARLCSPGGGVLEYLKLEIPSTHLTESVGLVSSGLELMVSDGVSRLKIEHYRSDGTLAGEDYDFASPLPIGSWFHLAVDAVLSPAANGSVRVIVDGSSKPALDIVNVVTRTESPAAERLVVGAFTAATDRSGTVFVDNVVVTATP